VDTHQLRHEFVVDSVYNIETDIDARHKILKRIKRRVQENRYPPQHSQKHIAMGHAFVSNKANRISDLFTLISLDCNT
jgi:hypothetical protein